MTQDELPTVLGDPAQIRQLFQNLVSNAIKFRGERPPRVHISAHPDGVHWVLSVRDNGIGIDENHRQEVFQIFRRLHTHEEHEGTGIGLAICKRIVERHGGTIWCESAPAGGSVFLFTIPSTATEEPTSPEAAEQTPESTSPSRTERSRTRATPRSLVGS